MNRQWPAQNVRLTGEAREGFFFIQQQVLYGLCVTG